MLLNKKSGTVEALFLVLWSIIVDKYGKPVFNKFIAGKCTTEFLKIR